MGSTMGRAGALGLGLAILLGASGPGAADEGVLSYYVGVRAVGTWSLMDDARTSGFAGTPLVENDTDAVAGLGVAFGYRARTLPFRLELEVLHRFRFDFDVRDVAPGGTIDNEMNVSTDSALLSAIAEWRNDSSLTPFAGLTVGWARNNVNTTRTPLAGGAQSERDTHSDEFAWGALVGVDWDFAESWAAQVAYRYIDLGEVDAGTGPAGDTISAADYTSHDLLLGLLLRF